MTHPHRLTLFPGHPLKGSYTLPGDKSLSHRAALFAALAEGESVIENFLSANVTTAMLQALSAIGVSWRLQKDVLRIHSQGLASWQKPTAPLDCGNSATSLRLLAGALSASGLAAVLDGTPGLRRRPMARILKPLRQMGVNIQAASGDTAPLALDHRSSSQSLLPLHYQMPISSAQVKSCLLLAALAADGETTLSEPFPSRDHTERMLRAMGVQVVSNFEHGMCITRLRPPWPFCLAPLNMVLPGDISAAAFLIVAALITPGSEVRLCNVGLNPTRTGLLDALARMGAEIEVHPYPAPGVPSTYVDASPGDLPSALSSQAFEPAGDLIVRHSRLQATEVSGSLVVRMIDEFPAFAVAAAFASGETVVSQAEELRYKESDRIGALVGELDKLGVQVAERPDGFSIIGGKLPLEATVDAYGDHRLAMALALAGLAGKGAVTVTGAQVIAESFPEFPLALQALGAELRWESNS